MGMPEAAFCIACEYRDVRSLCGADGLLERSVLNLWLSIGAGLPPTRPASVPASPPSSRGGSPMQLRSARSADSDGLQQQLLRQHAGGAAGAGGRGPLAAGPVEAGVAASQQTAASSTQGGSDGWATSCEGSSEAAQPRSKEALQRLLAMGFPRQPAAAALEAGGGDLAASIDILSGD